MLSGPYNLKITRELLDALGHSPKKSLGQNFLVDGNIVRKSLELAQVRAGDTIVEIGPGLGTLTLTLLQAGARVFAVERDATLAAHLRERVAPLFPQTFNLLEADAMDFPLAAFPQAGVPAAEAADFKIVANLPYAISTPWMDAVLERAPLPQTLVLMLQKEAAERFAAAAGTKNFGALSVFLDAAYERAPGHRVPAQCFFPTPKVDSVLLHLRRRERPILFAQTARRLIRALFTFRRKQLGSALKKILKTDERAPADDFSAVPAERISAWLGELPKFGASELSRAENVPVDAWLRLNELLAAE